jgi:hypothetical protein
VRTVVNATVVQICFMPLYETGLPLRSHYFHDWTSRKEQGMPIDCYLHSAMYVCIFRTNAASEPIHTRSTRCISTACQGRCFSQKPPSQNRKQSTTWLLSPNQEKYAEEQCHCSVFPNPHIPMQSNTTQVQSIMMIAPVPNQSSDSIKQKPDPYPPLHHHAAQRP